MRDLETAFSIMKANAPLMDFVGPRLEGLVSAAEKAVGFPFPNTYRKSVLELGAVNFGAMEIYGVIDDDFVNSCVPDGVWCTLQERAKGYIPPGFSGFSDTGIGSAYYLDLTQRDAQGECPVFEVYPGANLAELPPEKVADDCCSSSKKNWQSRRNLRRIRTDAPSHRPDRSVFQRRPHSGRPLSAHHWNLRTRLGCSSVK